MTDVTGRNGGYSELVTDNEQEAKNFAADSIKHPYAQLTIRRLGNDYCLTVCTKVEALVDDASESVHCCQCAEQHELARSADEGMSRRAETDVHRRT